jgi:hypothetical protein
VARAAFRFGFAGGLAFGLVAGFAGFGDFIARLAADFASGLLAGFTGLAGAFDLPAGLAARALPARGDVFLVLLFAMILISEPHHPARIRAF